MAKVRFRCPECNARLSASDKHFGDVGKCPKCDAAFEITADIIEDAGPDSAVHWETVEMISPGGAPAQTFDFDSYDKEHKKTIDEHEVLPPPEPAAPFDRRSAEGARPADEQPPRPRPQPRGPAAAPQPQAISVDDLPAGPPEYPLLRFVSACFKAVGGTALVLGTLGFLVVIVLAIAGRSGQTPVLHMLGEAGAVFMGGALVYAAGELLALMPDIRAEAWRQTELLRAILRKMIEQQRQG